MSLFTVLATAGDGLRRAEAEPTESPGSAEPPARRESVRGRFGLETSTFWPVFPGVISVAGTARLWQRGDLRGDLIIAPFWRPEETRDDEGTFASYELNIGYRQYFLRGLFAEAIVSPGRGVLTDSVYTMRDYRSFDIETAGAVGYRQDVYGPLYLSLMAGVRYVAYKSNAWPLDETGSTSESPIFTGDLRVGLSFR